MGFINLTKKIPICQLAWIIWLLVVATMLAIYVMLLWYPICELPNFIESLLAGMSIPFSIFIANTYLFIVCFRKNRNNTIRFIPILVLTVLLAVSFVKRDFEIERIMWEFDGVITKRSK